MDGDVSRRRARVQRVRVQEQPPQILEGRDGDGRFARPTHRRARHGVEHPLRQNDARAARIVHDDTADEFTATIGPHNELPPVQRMPTVCQGADIGPPRIMLWG